MKGSAYYALRALRQAASSRACKGLETLETALSSRRSTPAGNSFARPALLPLLSCAVIGMCAIGRSASAQTAPAQPATPAAPAAAQPAAPAAPPPPTPGAVTITGLLDVNYGLNFSHPQPAGSYNTTSTTITHVTNNGRAFDYHENFGFELGELNISRTANKSFPLGVTATLTVGDTPPVVYANEPGGKQGFEGIQQLYVTYTTPTAPLIKNPIVIDFGKFVTPFGMEVIEAPSNDEYSRGFVFNYAVPLYHTGFRFTAPLTPKINFVGGLVNGWNNTTDDNNAKSIFGQATWTPTSYFTGIIGYMGGLEGRGAYGVNYPSGGKTGINTNLFEIEPTFTPTAKLKIAGDFVYGEGDGNVTQPNASGLPNGHVSGTWLGVAGYARYQVTTPLAVAGRIEQFEDHGGLRTGLANYTKLNSFTLTLEYAALRSHLISRLEYRFDDSNRQVFLGNGSSTPQQPTLYLGEMYKF